LLLETGPSDPRGAGGPDFFSGIEANLSPSKGFGLILFPLELFRPSYGPEE